MTDRPIIFSAPMVRALLDGTKTQTRRMLNPQPTAEAASIRQIATDKATGAPVFNFYNKSRDPIYAIPCKHGLLGAFIPRYAVGDRLWVRENWLVDHTNCMSGPYLPPQGMTHGELVENAFLHFAATDEPNNWEAEKPRWKPSIHMPRWASRLTLIVTDVRVQRLQEISEEDAIAEGVVKVRGSCHVIKGFDYDLAGLCHNSAITPFAKLWNHINGPEAWDANPWVVAVSFDVHHGNIDQLDRQEAA